MTNLTADFSVQTSTRLYAYFLIYLIKKNKSLIKVNHFQIL